MHSIKIKISSADNAFIIVKNSVAKPGFDSLAAMFEITDIPDGVGAEKALALFKSTSFLPLGAQRYSFPFSSLGRGRIVWSLTTGQAAKAMGLTDGRLRQLIGAGYLHATKGIDGKYYIDKADMEALKNRPETRGRKPALK